MQQTRKHTADFGVMHKTMIEETIKLITGSRDYVPSSGYNLDGMEYDIEMHFSPNGTLKLNSIKRSEDRECMFDITLSVMETTSGLHQVRSAIYELWEDIKYDYYESSSFILGMSSGEFRFITIINEINKFYVTGRIVIIGTTYEKLANK